MASSPPLPPPHRTAVALGGSCPSRRANSSGSSSGGRRAWSSLSRNCSILCSYSVSNASGPGGSSTGSSCVPCLHDQVMAARAASRSGFRGRVELLLLRGVYRRRASELHDADPQPCGRNRIRLRDEHFRFVGGKCISKAFQHFPLIFCQVPVWILSNERYGVLEMTDLVSHTRVRWSSSSAHLSWPTSSCFRPAS